MSNEGKIDAPAVPQGYEIHEIPADYSGLVWLEGQVRAVARRAQAATGPQGWTDADSDAARLALELECLLMDTKNLSVVSKWWDSANDALELHRQRLAATTAPAPAQYKDSTPQLSVGESFESWFESYNPANKGDKQRSRDAYAAGMGDPLVAAAPAQDEPFGYFKPEPFGWTDCAEDDEGAIALYERPQEVGLTDEEIADIQDRLVAVSGYVADQDDRAAQAILKGTLKMLAALRAKGVSDERH